MRWEISTEITHIDVLNGSDAAWLKNGGEQLLSHAATHFVFSPVQFPQGFLLLDEGAEEWCGLFVTPTTTNLTKPELSHMGLTRSRDAINEFSWALIAVQEAEC